MKLEYLYIDGYKGLKRLKLQFKEQTGVVPVDFLIGCNGSGKSSVLEAVGFLPVSCKMNCRDLSLS